MPEDPVVRRHERAQRRLQDQAQTQLDQEAWRWKKGGSSTPGGAPGPKGPGGAEGPPAAKRRPRLDHRQNISTRRDPDRPQKGPCRHLPPGQVSLRGPDSKRIPMRCKRWSCEDCGPWLRRRLVDSIAEAAEAHGGLRRFVTLTLPRDARDPEEAWSRLGRMQAAFAERMAREWDQRPTYIWVREPHQDGWPHVHMIVDRYVPKSWLQAAWSAVGGGWTDIRFVDVQRVGGYVAKYMAKMPPDLPKGTRRYGCTRDILLKVYPKGDGTWVLEGWDPTTGTWSCIAGQARLKDLLRKRWPRWPDRPPDWSVARWLD